MERTCSLSAVPMLCEHVDICHKPLGLARYCCTNYLLLPDLVHHPLERVNPLTRTSKTLECFSFLL